jgi:hypothetical protein
MYYLHCMQIRHSRTHRCECWQEAADRESPSSGTTCSDPLLEDDRNCMRRLWARIDEVLEIDVQEQYQLHMKAATAKKGGKLATVCNVGKIIIISVQRTWSTVACRKMSATQVRSSIFILSYTGGSPSEKRSEPLHKLEIFFFSLPQFRLSTNLM